MGGVASLESSEIAGLAVSFTFVAILLVIFLLLFVVRHRMCPNRSAAPFRNFVVRKADSSEQHQQQVRNIKNNTTELDSKMVTSHASDAIVELKRAQPNSR